MTKGKRVKFSPEQLLEILKMYRDGEKLAYIAHKFQVSCAFVSVLARKHGLKMRMPKKNAVYSD